MTRNYQKTWEKKPWAQGWLTEAEEKYEARAYCKVCRQPLRAHATDLKKHSTSSIHQKNMESFKCPAGQRKLPPSFCPEFKQTEKVRDTKLCLHIAAHSSITTMDHLCDLLNTLGVEGGKLKMHRTKCTQVIKNIIAPSLLEELVAEVDGSNFSLIVDESTDVSVIQYLCLCIKYYKKSENKITTSFLGIIDVPSIKANDLHSSIKTFADEIGLDLHHLVGLGTDGANNLCGGNHSLFTLLRDEFNKKLLLIRCVCHSLNNAAAKAAEKLPAHTEFLCREIYNFFSQSSLRRKNFQDIREKNQPIFDSSAEGQKGKKEVFHQFVQLSTTRWLCRYNVVKVIRENWNFLKIYFAEFVSTNKEKNYTARQLNEMLHDDVNFLFLSFLEPLLHEVNIVNLLYQKNNVDAARAFEDLENLFRLVTQKIMKPAFFAQSTEAVMIALENPLSFLPRNKIDVGIECSKLLEKISLTVKSDFFSKAFDYLQSLCVEIGKRLPKHLSSLKQIKMFSPSICLNKKKPVKFKDLPFLNSFVKNEDLGKVENQWHKLSYVDWKQVSGNPKILEDAYEFWPFVGNYRNAGDVHVFGELSNYVIKLLVFPTSNAIVERAFSVMNAIKTKVRNRMKTTLLTSLLRIRLHFFETGVCCSNFEPTPLMLEKFNYKQLYLSNIDETKKDNLTPADLEILDILNDYQFVVCCSEDS